MFTILIYTGNIRPFEFEFPISYTSFFQWYANNIMNNLNGFRIFRVIYKHIKKKRPMSLIRLGDGEGAILGYPQYTSFSNAKGISKVWFGDTQLDHDDFLSISAQMKTAVQNADIVGLPREKQVAKLKLYEAVFKSLTNSNTISESTIITDAAVHRYLQFGLLYRPLLKNLAFLGLITSRDLRSELKQIFNIKHIELYQIKGESKFPGEVKEDHYPDQFEFLKNNIDVPYQGAVFLVGAGGLGKIYCDIIKQKGGIAIDIGAIFDAWAGVKSRLKRPCHSLKVYRDFPEIKVRRAMLRYNRLIDDLKLDTKKALPKDMEGSLKSW